MLCLLRKLANNKLLPRPIPGQEDANRESIDKKEHVQGEVQGCRRITG